MKKIYLLSKLWRYIGYCRLRLMYTFAFITNQKHVEVCREFLSKCANVDTADNDGWTPLHSNV
jgi:hypothetical protein